MNVVSPPRARRQSLCHQEGQGVWEGEEEEEQGEGAGRGQADRENDDSDQSPHGAASLAPRDSPESSQADLPARRESAPDVQPGYGASSSKASVQLAEEGGRRAEDGATRPTRTATHKHIPAAEKSFDPEGLFALAQVAAHAHADDTRSLPCPPLPSKHLRMHQFIAQRQPSQVAACRNVRGFQSDGQDGRDENIKKKPLLACNR